MIGMLSAFVWTFHFSALVVLCPTTVTTEVSLRISYNSSSMSRTYVGDYLTLNCQVAGDIQPNTYLSIVIKNKKENRRHAYFINPVLGSIYCKATGRLQYIVHSKINPMPLVDDTCDDSDTDSLTVTVVVASSRHPYLIGCEQHIAEGGTAALEFMEIPSIYRGPDNLTMNIPMTVREGEEFTVNCKVSHDGSPQSVYEYGIVRNGVFEKIADDVAFARYTATKEDRRGFNFTCRDKIHANHWKVPADVMATRWLYPQFIDIDSDENSTHHKLILSTGIRNKLTCNIIAHVGAEINYTWISSLDNETAATARTISLLRHGSADLNGTEENITCEGKVEGLTEKSIIWQIEWLSSDDDVTIIGSDHTTLGKSVAIIVGQFGMYIGGVVGLAVIALIIIGCRGRRKQQDEQLEIVPLPSANADKTTSRSNMVANDNAPERFEVTSEYDEIQEDQPTYDIPPPDNEYRNISADISTTRDCYEQLELTLVPSTDEHVYKTLTQSDR